jgi:hypothetical protein
MATEVLRHQPHTPLAWAPVRTRLDLAYALGGTKAVGIMLGNGNGTLSAQTTFPLGSFPYSIVISDLNQDMRPDIAFSLSVMNDVAVLLKTC